MLEPIAPAGAPVNVHRCADFEYCYHPRARDQQLIELVSQGMSTRRIAVRMDRSPQTIKGHLTNLYNVLGVDNRVSLVRRAFELGLLSIERAA